MRSPQMCREDCRLLMNGSPAVRDFGLTLFVRIFKELMLSALSIINPAAEKYLDFIAAAPRRNPV